MMQMVHSRFNALLSACVLSLIATAGWSQSLTWLGTLGGCCSSAHGVSDNGVVVGWATNAAGRARAFRWENGVMQDLGTLAGYEESYALDVSADGRVVVGYIRNIPARWRAIRWENGVMQDLGTLGGSNSQALGVSADGRVVVGVADNGGGQYRPVRWTASGGIQDLGDLGGGNGEAWGVSADGAVVVGGADPIPRVGAYPFRWTASRGMRALVYDWGMAFGVSADGSVVVGYSRGGAFRWTAAGGMQYLGMPSGYISNYAYAVSADGSVVVCTAEYAAGQGRAFRWTVGGGMENLNTTYASLLTNGSELREARAISPNGRYIVGVGYNAATERTEAFLLDTTGRPPCTLDGDLNGDRVVDDADLLILLFNFGNRCP